MKGKKLFTQSEICIIKTLIQEKLSSSKDKQKAIRRKIRNEMGFYWEDFHPKSEKPKIGFNIENFEKLIFNGDILQYGSTDILKPPMIQHKLPNSSFKQGLDPWVGESPRVLILGTLPGDESIRKQTYYTSSSNSFWQIMYTLFGQHKFQNNKEFITSHKIALWDCIQSAIRIGSTDNRIDEKTLIPNDLPSFLKKHPTINVIIFNGRKAADYYKRFFSCNEIYKMIKLCSTSGRTKIPINKKLEEWSIIKKLVE